ncbi:DUF4181 domain-containing protein [Bacillus sp. REN3]|uniref:DUF4181 domain-containing protein n=1 Tax=Bacillus sp. REN3 TaxID=2802440 RepID=UPI001AEECD26|nr:DUF4181 domain-containing protein [Bacillus sp. REN3]
MKILVFIVIALAIGVTVEYLLIKKCGIRRSKGLFYEGVNRKHIWIERAMLAVFLIMMWYIDEWSKFLVAYFIVFFGFRAFMEWKHERERKEYIVTTAGLGMFIIFIGVGYLMKIF